MYTTDCYYYKIESISLTTIVYIDCLSGETYVDIISDEGPTYVCSISFPEYVSGSEDYVVVNEGLCTYQTPTPTMTSTLTPTPTNTPTMTQTPTNTLTQTQTSLNFDCNYYYIINYNSVQQGFYVWTGCTGIVSVTPIDPLQSVYVCSLTEPIVEEYGAPLTIAYAGLCPSVTPTPSFTPTPTGTNITQTPTPTPTLTPSLTQTLIPVYNLWTAGYFEDACNLVNVPEPANVTFYSVIPFESLSPGDIIYGNAAQTIPPDTETNIISNGATFIQIDINTGVIINTGLCN